MTKDKQNIKTTDWLTRGIPKEQLERKKREAIREAEAELHNKQIKEIFAEIDKITLHYLNDADYSSGEMIYDIDQLKKKFTEGV